MPHLKDICVGCPKRKLWVGCSTYNGVPPYFNRQGQCPFNIKTEAKAKKKIRVGQQKQGRNRG